MVSLLDLPPELLGQIFSILIKGNLPSSRLLFEEPSDSLLHPGYHPLKNLSRVCGVLREFLFPSLFSYLKVDLNSLHGFLRFSESHSLSSLVKGLALYFNPNSQAMKSENPIIWVLMVRVIRSVKPPVITIMLAAPQLEQVLPYKLNLAYQGEFDIPFQVLHLRMPHEKILSSQTPQEIIGSQNVFKMREWSHCTFNQGCSINGYSSYKYFYKQAPSIFTPWEQNEIRRAVMEISFVSLASLDYIAIFPINHMQKFCVCMDLMKNLKRLRVQFAPTARNNVLDDPTTLSKCHPENLWLEFEACYSTLTFHISAKWHTESKSIEEFVSLDYVRPNLREMLDRVVGEHLVKWGSGSNRGRLTREEELSEEQNY